MGRPVRARAGACVRVGARACTQEVLDPPVGACTSRDNTCRETRRQAGTRTRVLGIMLEPQGEPVHFHYRPLCVQ